MADEAQAVIEAERAAGVARVRAAVAGDGRDDCEDCGEGIEAARRSAHPAARRCVSCQQAAERRGRQYRGA